MPKVSDIYNFLDEIAPFSSQEEWDNSGFLVGESDKCVKRALICLDCTESTINQAVENSCDLIVSHHPIIFRPQKSFTNQNPAYLAAKNGISVISSHTSYDFALGGVCDILAETIGITDIRKAPCGAYTLGKIEKITVSELAKTIKSIFKSDVCFCDGDKKVENIAVCSGAGFDFVEDAVKNGAEAYVTGECDHHEFLDAINMNIALVTAGHFETEIIAMKPLKEKLCEKFGDTEFILAKEESPIKHI